MDKYQQTFQLNLWPYETILTIKQYVEKKEGIKPSDQKIIYLWRVLQDFQKLEDINLSQDLNLYQEIKQFGNKTTMLLDINKTKINLFSIDEKPPFIKLNPNFTFKNIIHEIQYHFDIPYQMISSILINKTPLKENQQIQDLVEIEISPFELTIKLSRPIILAKTVSGKIIILNSQKSETIKNIKKQIENNYNIPISHQHIYYKNNILDNSVSLIKIGIKQLDMINIKCLLVENFTQEFSIQVINLTNLTIQIKILPFLEVINNLSVQMMYELGGHPSTMNYYIKGVSVTDGKNFSDFNMKENEKNFLGPKFHTCSN